MPEMDGITASRCIKQELRDQAPYIIACTADLQYDTRSACAQAGIDNYLEKVLHIRALLVVACMVLMSSAAMSAKWTATQAQRLVSSARGCSQCSGVAQTVKRSGC